MHFLTNTPDNVISLCNWMFQCHTIKGSHHIDLWPQKTRSRSTYSPVVVLHYEQWWPLISMTLVSILFSSHWWTMEKSYHCNLWPPQKIGQGRFVLSIKMYGQIKYQIYTLKKNGYGSILNDKMQMLQILESVTSWLWINVKFSLDLAHFGNEVWVCPNNRNEPNFTKSFNLTQSHT